MERTTMLIGALVVGTALAGCGGGSVGQPSGVPAPGPGGGGGDVQGSGVLVTESRPVPGFSRVTLGGVGHLIVEPGAAEALAITADDNILPLVTSVVHGDELVLGTVPGTSFSSAHGIVYRLTVVDLESLAVIGAAAAEVRGLESERFAVRVEGASAVTATGRTDEHDVVVIGASAYDAAGLESRAVRLEVAGACAVLVRASRSLEGRIDGPSSVEYIGDPTVDVALTGGASLRQIEGWRSELR